MLLDIFYPIICMINLESNILLKIKLMFMNNKQKVIFGTLIFIILSALFVGYLFYIDQSETYSFGNFSIEAPKGYEFKDISDEYENNSFMKVYRCVNEDLTVSSMDKITLKVRITIILVL